MAKLYFRHGTLASGKSLQLLSVNHNYKEQGKNTILLKPELDTRTTNISSRIGVDAECCTISKETNIYEHINKISNCNINKLDCILVDEAQFLSKEHIKQLSTIAWRLNIPVICYGLKNTYLDGVLFEGSEALLYYADSIEELKTTCECCNKKATMNLRLIDGKEIYDGSIVNIGDIKGTDRYASVCKEHYYNYN